MISLSYKENGVFIMHFGLGFVVDFGYLFQW